MIIREIVPTVPPECDVHGFLYECDSKHEMGEDMLDVSLPNGVLIIAGWYPEGDPSGCYCVSVYRGYEELIPALESGDIEAATADVEQCVQQFFDRNLQTVSDSESTCQFTGLVTT